MIDIDISRAEWGAQAAQTADPGQQVARPGDPSSLTGLIQDVSSKLRLDLQFDSIADIGCGNGLILSHLCVDVSRVAGIDYSDTMIAEAKRNLPEGEFIASEANDVPFETGRYDRVLCYSIFHYFPSKNYAIDVLQHLMRIASHDSIVLLGDLLDAQFEDTIKGGSDPEIEKTLPKIHRYSNWRFYDLEQLCEIARNKGFSAEILEQPANFRLREYRKDIRLCRSTN